MPGLHLRTFFDLKSIKVPTTYLLTFLINQHFSEDRGEKKPGRF